jgi:hypothetical protein
VADILDDLDTLCIFLFTVIPDAFLEVLASIHENGVGLPRLVEGSLQGVFHGLAIPVVRYLQADAFAVIQADRRLFC